MITIRRYRKPVGNGMAGKVNGIAVSAIGAGSMLMWSGVKGWSLLGLTGDIISGKKPTGGEVNILTAPNTGAISNTVISGAGLSAIASIAVLYKGHAYQFGGAPGKDGTHPWDCSSFANWVVAVRAGMAIPGYGKGQYDGSVHGPPTGLWGIWPGLQHIQRSQLQAGDLIVWFGHMGIAIDNNNMISALNSQKGTVETPIDGFGNGPLLCYGRL